MTTIHSTKQLPIAQSHSNSSRDSATNNCCCTIIAKVVNALVSPIFFLIDMVYTGIKNLLSAMGCNSSSGKVIDFYRGTASNPSGVTLNEIWSWNDQKLESVHDYIQWLFPTKNPSDFNSNAPLLDQETIQAFLNDAQLRANLLHSFKRMLAFYGLQLNETTMQISRAPNHLSRQSVWLTSGNHNFRRITRIMTSLSTLGLKPQAQSLFRAVHGIAQQEGRNVVGSGTLAHWRKAIQ
jgi:hypothetical protein